MTKPKIYITGAGCVSAIGMDAGSNRKMLAAGADGLRHAAHLRSKYAAEHFFGEVPYTDSQLKDIAKLCKGTEFTRTELLASIAFGEAAKSAGLSKAELSMRSTALVSASTVGGMCHTELFYSDASGHTSSSEFSGSYNYSAHTLKLAAMHGIKGHTATINTACSSSANAILIACRLIASGRAKRVIAGGADALSMFTANGFASLQLLASGKCCPFSGTQAGLNLGEGAAYLVLEHEDTASGKALLAEITGCGNATDAFHSTSLSPEGTGVKLCMEEAIKMAGIGRSDISVINAHGTGTANNDSVEMDAYSSFFGSVPPYSSTKSFTGHCLGAAGSLEAVYAVLSLKHSEVYASLRSGSKGSLNQPAQIYAPLPKALYAMSNSFAFGGNCTSLIFKHA
jgi:3-oxoacyl-(acyl-carrier-protein) synthase